MDYDRFAFCFDCCISSYCYQCVMWFLLNCCIKSPISNFIDLVGAQCQPLRVRNYPRRHELTFVTCLKQRCSGLATFESMQWARLGLEMSGHLVLPPVASVNVTTESRLVVMFEFVLFGFGQSIRFLWFPVVQQPKSTFSTDSIMAGTQQLTHFTFRLCFTPI